MRFVVDMMLGKLAKWLRIMGYDTLYFNPIDDHELLSIAKQEDRVLITRDTHLVGRRGIQRFVLVHANDPLEQLKETISGLSLTEESVRLFSRCIRCNSPLVNISREAARESVPPFVYLNHQTFSRCPDCRKVYWEGTHRQKMLETIRTVF